MAPDQSALLDLLGQLKLTDVSDRTRPRTLKTTVGDLNLKIPKLRLGVVLPALLKRRRRVDQALFAVAMEAYLHGVSTRKVDDLIKALGAESGIPKSEVSRICADLDTEVGAQFDEVARMLSRSHSKVAAMLDDARSNLLGFAGLPQRHWRQVWSRNPLERVNKEIKRRTDVVGVFPNPAALLRLAGAVLVQQHDEREACDRRYFSGPPCWS